MSIFEKIEKKYELKLKEPPVRPEGGFMHKMYKIETERGTYAVKLLNKYVMQREDAMDNYAEAERLELMPEQRDIPIIPALLFEGRKMQEIDGEFFYIFDYYDGKPLRRKEITEYRCAEMGGALAEIHKTDRKASDGRFEEMSIDWSFYLAEMKKTGMRVYEMLEANYALIQESQDSGNRARKKLPRVLSVCHNDMD